MRRQKEGKGTLSGVKSTSVAQGVGSKKKQDSMEQELKLWVSRGNESETQGWEWKKKAAGQCMNAAVIHCPWDVLIWFS